MTFHLASVVVSEQLIFFFAGLKLSANFFIRKKLVDVETPNTRIKDT